ncbi:endospore germination permease [Virgibacillus sp. 6R]|uniref:GerAB/ArcD/ProY family transporter n=1 Tax=Metabacillus sp. 22489 TaxID=3453928 RepID=UPI0011A7A526
MMNEPRRISVFQAAAIMINSSIGVSLLALPRIASEKAGSGALFVTLLAVILFITSVWICSTLAKRFPKESFLAYSQTIIGKRFGKIAAFMMICFFLFTTSIVLREFGEVLSTSLMQETPISVTILSMLVLIAITTRNNITTISYFHTYYLPFIVIPIVSIAIIAFKDIDWRHLKPFLGNETTLADFVGGAISIAGLPFIPITLFIIFVIAPHMVEPKRIVKGALSGSFVAAIMFFLATGITLAVFGAEELKKSMWPMLVLTRMSELPSSILERLDILFLMVWIISAFTTLLSGYLICIEFASQLFRLRSHRVLSYLALPLLYALAFYPRNALHLSQIMSHVGVWSVLITTGYPLVLLLIAIIRGKEGKACERSDATK